jgi:DNA-binding CsgD family transcriptional regulator
VLRLLAVGHSDGEIARALFISKKTAAVHVANIKGKLGANSRVEIVRMALRSGLVDAAS